MSVTSPTVEPGGVKRRSKRTISVTSPTVEPGGVKNDVRDVTDCRARRGKKEERKRNDVRDVTDCRARR
eukprot:14105011-Alexandrium_andersonii.AAC.1